MVEIIGRDGQIRVLRTLLDDATDGRGAALVLRGEAGIGKSALLEHTARAAREAGIRVLGVSGVPAEGGIAYAGLELLLRPVTTAPLDSGSPYRMAIRVLQLLGERETPTLLAIDDAHWLDAATWETLAFLCRRLGSDPIAVVMTVRDSDDVDMRLAAAGLTAIRVEALGSEDAGLVVDRLVPGLAPALRARVLDEAAGNPLGLVELGAAAARDGGAALLPSSLPLSAQVERTFGGLVAELPPETRALLTAAALNDGTRLDEALAVAGVAAEAVQPAVTTRLVTVDDQYELRFRHPLLRSALRRQTAPAQRRRIHAAFAKVLAGSPHREVWHRASAAPGPDERLAAELTRVARGAAERQAVAVALAAVNRAIQLSQDRGERARRQLWAVGLAHEQGDAQTVRSILADIDDSALGAAEQARVTMVRDSYHESAWSGPERLMAYADLIDTMRREGDTDNAAQALVDIALRVYYSNVPAPVRERFIEVTLAVGLADDDPRRTAILALIAPVEHGAEALEQLRKFVHQPEIPPSMRCELAIGAWAIGAFEIAVTLAISSANDARALGRLGTLSHSLNNAASSSSSLGHTRQTLSLAAECITLADEIGHPLWSLGAGLSAAMAEALRGDVVAARRRADEAEQVLSAGRRLPILSRVQRVRGVAALAEGQAEDAFRQLMQVFDPEAVAWFPNQQLHTLGHLAEAAVLAGLQDELRPIVDDLAPVAERSQSPALRFGLDYARAVLTGDYETALAADLTDWPFERARLQLTYGSALRRAYRVGESRPLLRAAAAGFDSLGATPWADRARAELRATGETRRKPADALDTLTPQEHQIARLAAEGLSNREIGERLFLSPRTVSTHLYRIFPKIKVRSRAELARVLTSSDAI